MQGLQQQQEATEAAIPRLAVFYPTSYIYNLAGLRRVCPISLNKEKADKTECIEICEEWFTTGGLNPPYKFPRKASLACYYRYKYFQPMRSRAKRSRFYLPT